jgi:hypothetical protein
MSSEVAAGSPGIVVVVAGAVVVVVGDVVVVVVLSGDEVGPWVVEVVVGAAPPCAPARAEGTMPTRANDRTVVEIKSVSLSLR